MKVIKGNEIDITDQIVFSEPWLRNHYWQPCPPNCFRLLRVNLEKGGYDVWVTNGVYMKTYTIHREGCMEFLRKEKKMGSTILDDANIGLDF